MTDEEKAEDWEIVKPEPMKTKCATEQEHKTDLNFY